LGHPTAGDDVFILYALLIALIVGILAGGRPARLGSLTIRWSWVIAWGLAAQLVLFSDPVTRIVGDAGPIIYVATTGCVLLAVLANRHIPGIPLVVAGASANLAAIVANGGYMPASAAALATLGKSAPTTYSNSALVASPALWPLTDIFAMPRWVPFANVFSLGDVLIGLGVATVIVVAMRREPEPRRESRLAPPIGPAAEG
jgi:hypothetical protein